MEYHLEKPSWQRWDSNLRRRLSVNSFAVHSTIMLPPKKKASSPEISNCRLSYSSMFFLTSWQTLILGYKYPTTLHRSSFDVIFCGRLMV